MIKCREKAIEVDPDFQAAYFHLGQAYASYNKLDKAISCFENAVRLEKKDLDALNRLGGALLGSNRIE